MPWETTADVGEFLAKSGPFLGSDPVANNVLLTEAHFWQWLANPAPGDRFGWWAEGDQVHSAYLQILGHDPICSSLTCPAAADLPRVLGDAVRLGVQAKDAAAVTAAWRVEGKVLETRARIALLRLQHLSPRGLADGAPRRARADDLPLLRDWFGLFQERCPDDPSQVEFVVDHPLEAGALVMWEVDGRPVAMSSRTPEVAGMVRMGLAFQPTQGVTFANAAFAFGCAEAALTAAHVLVLSGNPATTARLRSLGFVPVLDRAVLEVRNLERL